MESAHCCASKSYIAPFMPNRRNSVSGLDRRVSGSLANRPACAIVRGAGTLCGYVSAWHTARIVSEGQNRR